MNVTREKRVFWHTKMIHIARYYSVFLWIFGWYIIHPIINEGITELPSFIYGAFFKDWAVSLAFLSVPFFWIIVSILATANNTKTLELKDDSLLINFFGILKEKSLQLNYSDISSLEWSQDGFKHFVFNLKNGEKKLIKTEIIDRNKAFEIIKEKIKESQKLNPNQPILGNPLNHQNA